jgi:small subunit ribosomal protein S5
MTTQNPNLEKKEQTKPFIRNNQSTSGNTPSRPFAPRGDNNSGGERRSFNGPRRDRNDRNNKPGANNRGGGDKGGFAGRRKFNDRKKNEANDSNIESQVIDVRRVSKTVKGGKNMRFSALVVAGNKAGGIGYGLAKGLDFQDAVAKATRKAKDRMINIHITDDASVAFSSKYKFKSCLLYIKPATLGTGLIAGGYFRSVLYLAGVKNAYTKIIGSNNKVVGVRASIQALEEYYLLKAGQKNTINSVKEATKETTSETTSDEVKSTK